MSLITSEELFEYIRLPIHFRLNSHILYLHFQVDGALRLSGLSRYALYTPLESVFVLAFFIRLLNSPLLYALGTKRIITQWVRYGVSRNRPHNAFNTRKFILEFLLIIIEIAGYASDTVLAWHSIASVGVLHSENGE